MVATEGLRAPFPGTAIAWTGLHPPGIRPASAGAALDGLPARS